MIFRELKCEKCGDFVTEFTFERNNEKFFEIKTPVLCEECTKKRNGEV